MKKMIWGQHIDTKAFTLIELLAVIVILAIIALIVTPIILNIINESKIESDKRNIENVISAAKLYAIELDMKKEEIDETKNIYSKLKLDSKPNGEIYVYLNDKKEVSIIAELNGRRYEKDFNDVLKLIDNDINSVDEPTLKNIVLPSGITKEQIEIMEFKKITTSTFNSLVQRLNSKEEYIYDVSKKQDKSIIEYIEDKDNNSLYEVYIVSNKTIMAPTSCISLFQNFKNLDILNLINFDTSKITSMKNLFYSTGYNSSVFTLDLGEKFDTSNVTDMGSMFFATGYNSSIFTLNLGDKFDTSNVTNMSNMFRSTGYNSPEFTLNFGNKFDTSNVTNMGLMFYSTGYNSSIFTLNLGDNFDTSNVTAMNSMFQQAGYSSQKFTLDLGDKFNTNKVTNMQSMFSNTGYNSQMFALDLGDNFDTKNVTNMREMFYRTGYSSPIFTLDLGDKFDTSEVTNTQSMFANTGYSSPIFTLNLGNKFNTENLTNMNYMFSNLGHGNSNFVLDLGDEFLNINASTYLYQLPSNSIIKVPKELFVDEHNIRLNKDSEEFITLNNKTFVSR